MDLTLYALLNGIQFTANLHGIEKATVKNWIRDLDFDRDPFFVKIRNLVIKTAKKIGIERTCMLFECPRRTLEILMQEFGNDEIELEFPVKRSRLGDNEGRETKKRAIKMHIKGRSPSEISLALQVGEEKIRAWTDYYDVKKKEKKTTKEEAPINISNVKSDPEIEKRMKREDVRIIPETVNLEEIQELDPFDIMLQDSKE